MLKLNRLNLFKGLSALIGLAVWAPSFAVESNARPLQQTPRLTSSSGAGTAAGRGMPPKTSAPAKPIVVAGEITLLGGGNPVRLTPVTHTKAFDLEITAIGTTYKVDLAGGWQLSMQQLAALGSRSWNISLATKGSRPLTCGGSTMTREPRLVHCEAANAVMSVDRTKLTLDFSETRLVEDSGQKSARITGQIVIALPAPLLIARLADYPSRSSGTVIINGEQRSLAVIFPYPATASEGSRLDVLLEAPLVSSGFTLDARSIRFTAQDENIPGKGVTYNCGRPLTDAEYACIGAPSTMRRSCDRPFLKEALQCRSIDYTDTDGSIQASFDEALYDDITSRTVKSIRVQGKLAVGPAVRGKISSADGRFVCSDGSRCRVNRSVSTSGQDIRELVILSLTQSDGSTRALSFVRSLLYPDRVDVMLDLAFAGSTWGQDGYAAVDPKAIRFDDASSEIKLESLRLTQIRGHDSVVFSGSVKAFAR